MSLKNQLQKQHTKNYFEHTDNLLRTALTPSNYCLSSSNYYRLLRWSYITEFAYPDFQMQLRTAARQLHPPPSSTPPNSPYFGADSYTAFKGHRESSILGCSVQVWLAEKNVAPKFTESLTQKCDGILIGGRARSYRLRRSVGALLKPKMEPVRGPELESEWFSLGRHR